MLLIHGRHRFRKKIIDTNHGACKTCDQDTDWELEQSTDWGHLFWIPIIPLGSCTRWRCLQCGIDPLLRTKTSITAKILLLIVGLPLVAAVFVDPNDPGVSPEDKQILWAMRVILPLAYLFFVRHVVRQIRAGRRERDRQRQLVNYPLADADHLRDRLQALNFYRHLSPVDEVNRELEELEAKLGAKLPVDYRLALLHLGVIYGVANDAEFSLFTPSQVIELCNGWNFDKLPPDQFQTVGIGGYDCGGDFLGFVRRGKKFSPQLVMLDHECGMCLGNADLVDEVLADSLLDFIREQLTPSRESN